jgi:PKD repeat protein
MNVTINPLPVTAIKKSKDNCVENSSTVVYLIDNPTEGSYYFWGVEELPVPVPGAPKPIRDQLNPTADRDSLSDQMYLYPAHALPWKGFITAQERNKFGCKAPSARMLVEVMPAPVVNAGPDRIVCEREIFYMNATVDGYDHTNLPAGTYKIEWHPRNDMVGATDILNPKVDPHSSNIIDFRVSKGGCMSSWDHVTITVNPKPNAPRVPDAVYCSSEAQWKMNVENIGKHADGVTWNKITWKRWDDAALKSVSIGNSDNAHSLIMNEETSPGVLNHTGALPAPLAYDASMQTVITYNVRQTNELGCVSDSATGRMIMRKSPDKPEVEKEAYCLKEGGYELYVAGNSISWYSSATSTIPVNTGNTYKPMPAADGTYPYWVTQKEINGCESGRAVKNLIVHPLPALAFEVRDIAGNITTGGCADFDVLAKNLSGSPDTDVTYTWRWGDNVNNDQSAPAGTAVGHTYTNTGSAKENRTIILTGVSKVHYNTSDNVYCSNTASRVLAISPGVTAGFEVSATEGCAPLLARLNSGQSVNAYNFRWYWNLNHEPANNETGYGDLRPNPDHEFVNPSQTAKAEYHVWLQVDNGTCFDNVEKVITVYPMPKASFTTPDLPADNSFCPPDDVRFVNTSTGNLPGTEYEWNYSDGSFDTYTTTQEALHEFDNLGATPVTRNVVLTASNKWGTNGAYTCSAGDNKYITVNPRVTAEFTYDKEACAPVVMGFTSQIIGTANKYTWDWGDGTPVGTGSIPSHPYDNPSPDQPVTRTVTLIAENNWCKDEVKHTIQINPKPHVGFTVDNVQGCQPLDVTFYNTSTGNPAGTAYSYDFGDASFDNTGNQQVTHTYINLQAQNAYLSPVLTARNQWGCTNTFSLPITVFPYVKADFRMSATEGCAPLAVSFTNGSRGYDPGSLYWEFGDGGTSGDMNPSHIFNNQSMSQEVKYTVTLKVWTGSCSDSQTQEVTVFGNPRADFVANPPVQIYPGAPVKLENLIPAADINNLTYVWSQADHGSNAGVPFSTLPNPADLSITGWGDFDITQQVFTMDGNCSSVKMVTISIIPPRPEARFDSVPPACMPYKVQFKNNSEYGRTYQWVFGDGSTSTKKDPEHTYQDAGTYRVTLTVTGDNATPITTTRYITVHPMPHAAFEVEPKFLWVGQTLRGFNYTSNQTTSGQAYDVWYRWNWGDGTPEDTAVNPSHVYRKAGRYDITLTAGTNTAPQCINSYTLSGAVDLENAGDIILPNSFKPSQSGETDGVVDPAGYQNELFYPPVLSPTRKYRLTIFSRWGQKLYETTDPNMGWNGYYRGRLCDEGVYVYKIEGVFETGQSFSKVGDILLLR